MHIVQDFLHKDLICPFKSMCDYKTEHRMFNAYYVNRGSYMSVHVLLTSWGKEIKCEACRSFYIFFATRLINSIIQEQNFRFYFAYDIKITLKSHFCRNNVIILSLCTQLCYGHHNIY